MESKKFPKKCRHCGSLKFERDAVGSLEWMNFRCGSSCDQRGEWSQSDECRITELEAIEAAKDARIASLTSEVQRLRDSQVTPIRIRKAYNRALDRMVNYGVSMSVAAQNMLRVNLIEELVKEDNPNA